MFSPNLLFYFIFLTYVVTHTYNLIAPGSILTTPSVHTLSPEVLVWFPPLNQFVVSDGIASSK